MRPILLHFVLNASRHLSALVRHLSGTLPVLPPAVRPHRDHDTSRGSSAGAYRSTDFVILDYWLGKERSQLVMKHVCCDQRVLVPWGYGVHTFHTPCGSTATEEKLSQRNQYQLRGTQRERRLESVEFHRGNNAATLEKGEINSISSKSVGKD